MSSGFESGNERRERVEKLSTFETLYRLGEPQHALRTYTLDAVPSAPEINLVQTGAWRDIIGLYRQRASPMLVSEMYGEQYADIPYAPLLTVGDTVYGDYTTPEGQDEFKDADLKLATEGFSPPPWAAELWRFSRLKQARTFARDDEMASLRGLDLVNGVTRFTVGAGRYSDSFYSMGSEGVRISLTQAERSALAAKALPSEHMAELEQLNSKLAREYGEVTLREAILRHTEGNVPAYNDHVYSASLGVAGTVLTEDNEYVFVKRGASVAVNRGINVTASGGADFDKEALSRYGIAEFLGGEMGRETAEEIGLTSGTLLLGAMKEKIRLEIGLEDASTYDLVPVGFARELPRGGSPESMFLIRYRGSTDDLVRTIMRNEHEDRAEIDTNVFAMPRADARALLVHPEGTQIIQHKAVLNLIFIEEWLKRNG